MKKDKILVSACLIGEACRYDGKDNKINEVLKLTKYFDLIPICPEINGGMKTPRRPSEIVGERVINNKGQDVSDYYANGAYLAETIARMYNVKMAILKEGSPSCGVHTIHNGKFDGGKIEGKGMTVRRLEALGVKCINEDEAKVLFAELETKNAQ
jgi:uncharacterized protein YbbK (DUF523 family)